MDQIISFAYPKNIFIMQEEQTFSSFFADYISYRSTRVRESSIIQAKTVYGKYLTSLHHKGIKEAFSEKNMRGVYSNIVSLTICDSWKNRIIGILRSMCKTAFAWKKIPSESYQDVMSILDNVPESKPKPLEKVIWTKKEEAKFLSSIHDQPTKVMFTLFIALGARLSEFLGLTWDCFDARKGTITIKQQLAHNSQKHFELIYFLKTKESYRVCKLDKDTRDILLDYRKSVAKPKGFIFRSPADPSMPMSKACFRNKLKKYIKISKVRPITPHGVRHTKASNLMKVCINMIDVIAVAKYMGHTPSVLLNTYSHEQEKTIDAIIKRLKN